MYCFLRVLVGVLVIYFNSFSVYAETASVNFGAQTLIWPWMWAGGKMLSAASGLDKPEIMRWRFAVANLDRYAELGFKWNLVILRQGRDGPDGWTRAKAIVREQERRGIATVFRLLEDPGIYRSLGEGGAVAEEAKKNYARWVGELASIFAGKVRYYVISNEIDHDFGYNLLHYRRIFVDYDHYRDLLDVAFRAIKRADPEARIVDHGVSAYSLGLAVAESIRKSQGILKAYVFWKRFHFDRSSSAGSLIRFAQMLASDWVHRRIDIANRSFMKPGPCDYHQLHWYFNPDVLPEVLDWIDKRQVKAGTRRPLFVTELGYRMPTKPGYAWDGRPTNVADYAHYDQEEHAASLVKNISLLIGHGVRDIEYWHVRFHHNRDTSAQLYLPTEEINEFKATQALIAYRRLIKLFDGPLLGAGCSSKDSRVECLFDLTERRIRVLWMRNGTLEWPLPTGLDSLFDYAGRQIMMRGRQRIVLTEKPIILVEPAHTTINTGIAADVQHVRSGSKE